MRSLNEIRVKVGCSLVDLIMSFEIALNVAKYLLPDVWRIADDYIEPTSRHDLWELCFPIERSDQAIDYIVQLDIGVNQGVAALYVVAQIWQCPLSGGPPFKRLNFFAALVFQNLQEQRQLCDLYSLLVDVHAIDVVQKYPLSLGKGELPCPVA